MPPKKKGKSKSPGKKGKKKGSKSPAPKQRLFEADLALPLIPSASAAGFQAAVISQDVRTVSRVVEHYSGGSLAFLKEVDANGSTPLHLAVRNNDPLLVKKLLGYQLIDVNLCETRALGGHAAVHIACASGFDKVLQLLLDAGVDTHVKADSALGERPLHSCCKHGQTACARLLLDAGVMPDLRDSFGHNAAYWAQQRGHTALLAELGERLPAPKAATAQEYIALMQEKLQGKFKLPALGKGKKGKGGKSKSPGKGKKKGKK